jgi:2-polyprenyl-3-methyl-5-hydroxy-6-metoxy-1,4-benzoquinol methylase
LPKKIIKNKIRKGKSMTSVVQDLEAARTRVKTIWTSGDFGKIAESIQTHADEFVARLPVTPDLKVLDLACGTGNLAVRAAQRGAKVSGIDIAPNLIASAKVRALLSGLDIKFEEGDVEMLPYADASFDLVMSMYGVMFAAHPQIAASELLRVAAPGATIALANWTPTGFIGQMLKTVGAHIPPPPGSVSPILWGVENTVWERLGAATSEIKFAKREVVFEYPYSPAETVQFFSKFYGPTLRAFAACNSLKKHFALRHDLEQLWTAHNKATDGSTYVVSEYLEVIATRA